mgnify:FL=1|jgi:tRNA(Arg) A34 adenosine deaminase TadA|tara:strand:+ start:138 stop:533 length:396 start_codon:yes stop_codon:yes gene_type:complete
MNVSKKTSGYLHLARRMAEQSTYGNISHGAVLVKGGSVINASYNKDNSCSFGSRFRDPDRGRATLHAELGCILNLDKSVTQGATIYVVRVGKRGDFKMSKPCPMCNGALKHVGIKKVFYTSDEGTLESYKL